MGMNLKMNEKFLARRPERAKRFNDAAPRGDCAKNVSRNVGAIPYMHA